MKTLAIRAAIAACVAAAAPLALAQTAGSPGVTSGTHDPIRTDKLFDLTVGVNSTYNAANDAVNGGVVTTPIGFSTVNELFDAVVSTARLQSINGAYTSNSPSVIRVGYRGLPMVITTAAGSPAINLSVPAIGVNVNFNQHTSRDANADELRDYLKDNGGDILNRIQQALVRTSPVDPIAGNPGSLQTMMVNDEFDRSFVAFASNIRNEAPDGAGTIGTNNLIGIGAEYSTFTAGGVRSQSFTIPLSYVMRADADPRRQLTFYAPISINQSEGAYSASVRLGVSYRYPINDRWAITPGIGYGVTGSVDLGSAAAMMAATVTSQYTLKFDGFDLAIGNAVGLYQSHKISLRGYSFDPKVSNTVFRNGVLFSVPTVVMGQKMAYEFSYINTIYTGTELYSNHYNELGFTLGTNRSANSSRSYLRAGLSLFKGQKDLKGGKINIGYWF